MGEGWGRDGGDGQERSFLSIENRPNFTSIVCSKAFPKIFAS